jgi:hypothetical protein
LAPDNRRELLVHSAEDCEDLAEGHRAFRASYDLSCTADDGIGYPLNVSCRLEIVDDLSRCLLRHAQERCEDAQAGAIRWTEFEQHRMRHAQHAMSGLRQASEEFGLERPMETGSHHARRME